MRVQAVYPTFVIVLVNSRRTFDQADFLETSLPHMTLSGDANDSRTLQRMSFASAPSESGIIPGERKNKPDAIGVLEKESAENRDYLFRCVTT